MEKGNHTYTEITTQTEAWQQALELASAAPLPNPADYEQVIFTGCGSTYYLSIAAAAIYQELTGQIARAIPGSDMLLNSQIVLTKSKSILVAISRSGTTTETIKAAQKFKTERRGDVMVITNYDEILSREADFNIVIPKGQEISVAQTRSFASMLVAVTAISARMAGQNDLLAAMKVLPAIGTRLIHDYETYAKEIGENLDIDRFYFLGSGMRYGLASEVNLKMKEMTLTHSEPFHFLEYRHGPMSMVTDQTVLIGMLSDKNRLHEMKVMSEMQRMGARLVTLAESDAEIELRSGMPEIARGVLYLPVLQLMAFYRSLAKGLNPDRPNNLTAVVKLEF